MPTQQLIDIIIKAQDQASSTADKVDKSIQKIGQTSRGLGNIPGFDSLKSKLSGVASSIDGKFGGALTSVRNKLSGFRTGISTAATSIRGKFGAAVDKVRTKLSGLSKYMQKTGSGFGFLRNAASMAAGMIGYDLLNSIIETTRASLNARSGMQAFAKRLNMSATEVDTFQKSLDSLQSTYKKIDMDVVGQQATDMAFRLGLPKQSLSELTETTAIFTDAMQRNGRSAEDSMLAMSDAMDGQFVRLKEIGIGQDDLMRNGWDGDINNKTGLLKAMNKSLKEQHYDDLAKSVDTLDDAWKVLSITMSNLLERVLVPLTPVIVTIVNGVTDFIDLIMNNPLAQAVTLIGGLTIGFALLAGAISITEGGIAALVMGVMPGFIITLYEAAAGFMAITVAGAPLWAIVAVVAAVALAVYELGIAFGWWSDVGTMIDAIWAGLNRLWSAFISHPDVQAFLAAMTVAWNWLSAAVGQAINWVMSFFQNNNSGKFDFVRALINGIGYAWQAMTFPIRLVITIVRLFISTMVNIYNRVSAIITNIKNLFARLPGAIRGAISKLTSIITNPVQSARGRISGIVGSIKSVISGITHVNIGSLTSKLTAPVTNAYNNIAKTVSNIINKIKSIPHNIPGIGGAFGFDYEGMLEELSKQSGSANVYTSSNESLTLDHNINFSFDFTNLPEGTSEETLVAMLRSAITDRSVINSLVNSPDFQALDGKVKDRLLLKGNRARGV